ARASRSRSAQHHFFPGPFYLWVFLALWCASYEFHNLKHEYSSLTSDFKFTSLLRCSNSLDCDWFL
ncbi:UDP-N-acetylmuramoylalanine--D-glutamate ligase, partial [Frankliniella fusca]